MDVARDLVGVTVPDGTEEKGLRTVPKTERVESSPRVVDRLEDRPTVPPSAGCHKPPSGGSDTHPVYEIPPLLSFGDQV